MDLEFSSRSARSNGLSNIEKTIYQILYSGWWSVATNPCAKERSESVIIAQTLRPHNFVDTHALIIKSASIERPFSSLSIEANLVKNGCILKKVMGY